MGCLRADYQTAVAEEQSNSLGKFEHRFSVATLYRVNKATYDYCALSPIIA